MTGSWSVAGVDLHVDLDAAGGRRAALEHGLRDAIRSGRLQPQARLPATRRLAAELGLSRGTVQAAYDQLTAEGYLTARQGAGTVVTPLAEPPAGPAATGEAPAAPALDLRPGSPDTATFPVAAWLRAVRRALATATADTYGYGDPRGRIELRTALAEYLGRTRGVLARPGQIVVVSGYVQALALLTRVLAAAGGRTAALEDPGLGFHREVVRRGGLSVVPLPVDDRGARVAALAGPVDAVVVTPAHQYPTGVPLHPVRRRELVGWARACGALVVEDDYDGEFRYDRQPIGALQGTAPGQVAYLGTVSKSLAPALRLAWMVLPEHLVDPVVDLKLHSDHHTETLGQLALAELIAGHGYDRHVRAVRMRYRRRRDLLVDRLAPAGGDAPAGRVQGIAAGLHALVELPGDGPDEAELRGRAAAAGLALGWLGDHWHVPGDRPQGLVVGYGTPRERDYPAALDALTGLLSRPR
ncbi:PLP-dependent aminotransferase family protein [Streptomyces sp. NPDC089919]|uniref:MocR-like pyridoxine biosynthesis transcription factor PdxR n=1 Tax=Streptomyces sp. NPDC089919 TaxID=3155188 RepID=UPI0034477B94